MKTLINFMFLMMITVNLIAQNRELDVRTSSKLLAENAIYIETGWMLLDFPVSINYERLLKKWDRSHIVAQGGVGMLPNYGYPYAKASFKFLTGPKKHHLETGIGMVFDFQGDIVLPCVDLGYRYQAPDGKLLFKIGTGFPNLLSFGAGWAF